MAFSLTNVSTNALSKEMTTFTYVSGDNIATVTAANYFDPMILNLATVSVCTVIDTVNQFCYLVGLEHDGTNVTSPGTDITIKGA
jgi:hypothetical protein